jgi:hypothetical protein
MFKPVFFNGTPMMQKIDGSKCEDCVSLMMFPICVLVQDSQEADIIKSRYKKAPEDKNMDRE